MPRERVVLARKTTSTMTPVRWTDACPSDLNEVEAAEELGARWEGDELVTDDYEGLVELLEYYTNDEYLPDND